MHHVLVLPSRIKRDGGDHPVPSPSSDSIVATLLNDYGWVPLEVGGLADIRADRGGGGGLPPHQCFQNVAVKVKRT